MNAPPRVRRFTGGYHPAAGESKCHTKAASRSREPAKRTSYHEPHPARVRQPTPTRRNSSSSISTGTSSSNGDDSDAASSMGGPSAGVSRGRSALRKISLFGRSLYSSNQPGLQDVAGPLPGDYKEEFEGALSRSSSALSSRCSASPQPTRVEFSSSSRWSMRKAQPAQKEETMPPTQYAFSP